MDGLLKNVRYPRMESVQLDVALLDKSRKILANAAFFPVPQRIDQDDYRPFGVVLKSVKVSEGDLLQFKVNYIASAGQNSFNWTSTLTVDATSGKPVGIGRAPEEAW